MWSLQKPPSYMQWPSKASLATTAVWVSVNHKMSLPSLYGQYKIKQGKLSLKIEVFHNDSNCIYSKFQLSMLHLSRISMCPLRKSPATKNRSIILGEQESAARSINYIYPQWIDVSNGPRILFGLLDHEGHDLQGNANSGINLR